MENPPGVSLYDGGTINFEVLQPSVIEEEMEDEDDRQRNLELINNIENELSYEDESYQEHSSLCSNHESNVISNYENEVYKNDDYFMPEISQRNCDGYSIPEVSQKSDEYLMPVMNQRNKIVSEHGVEEEHRNPRSLNWSEHSDLSGNFSSQESLIKSPTKFHLEINQVNSQSDDSPPLYQNQNPINYVSSIGTSKITNDCEPPHYIKSYNNKVGMVESQEKFLSSDHSYGQLQLLYESRGREMDTLSEELKELKLSSNREISSLKHQLKIVKAEYETALISRDQLKVLLTENEGRIRLLSNDLKEKTQTLEVSLVDNKKLKQNVDILEATICSLELQISDLQSADSLARSKQLHEDFLQKLQNSHKEEVDDWKQKFKSMSNKAESAEEKIMKLEKDIFETGKLKERALQEKNEVINNLKENLETVQQQVKILLSSKSRKESKGNDDLQDLKLKVENLNEKLLLKESLLSQAKNDLETFDIILKMGIYKSFLPEDDSLGQLGLRKTLTFDDTTNEPILKRNPTNKTTTTTQDNFNVSDNVKQELLKCLMSNQKYRHEIQSLNENISEKQKQLQVIMSELKSIKEELKQAKSQQSTESNPSMHTLTEENTALKKDLATLLKQFIDIKNKGENMAKILQEFQNSTKNTLLCENKEFSSLNKAIVEYSNILEKFSIDQLQTWEELKRENIKLSSKRNLSESHFLNLLEQLKELKYELSIKVPIEYTDLNKMNQIVNDFTKNVNSISEEVSHLHKENVLFKNQLWTLRLELEKANKNNLTLTQQSDLLKKEKIDSEKEKFQAIESCKENYLKFHESSVVKVKEQLESEYSKVLSALKEEIDRLSNKLMEAQSNYMKICHEKNSLEEQYKINLTEKNCDQFKNDEILSQINVLQENEDLRRDLEDSKKNFVNLEKAYKDNLATLAAELCKRSNSNGVDKFTSIDESEIQFVSEKEENLKKEIVRWEQEYLRMKSEYMEEKHGLEEQLIECKTQIDNLNQNMKNNYANICCETQPEKSKESSAFVHITETIEKFKKLNFTLKKEKEALTCYYKNQMEELHNKLSTLTASYANNVVQTVDSSELKYKEEIIRLKAQASDLTNLVKQLKKDETKLITYHEEQIKTLTDEIQSLEVTVQEIKNEKERELQNYDKNIQKLGYEIIKYKGELTSCENKIASWEKKYSHLKTKFFKQQKNFDKLRYATEERINYYRTTTEHLSTKRTLEREALYKDFRDWLEKTRMVLANKISKVMEELKCIPERSIPFSVLEPHLKDLNLVYEMLSKLDIKEK